MRKLILLVVASVALASTAQAVTIGAGQLLVRTYDSQTGSQGFAKLNPATGDVTALPWMNGTVFNNGGQGNIWTMMGAVVAPSGDVYASVTWVNPNLQGSSCGCSYGIGRLDPLTGAITLLTDASGQPLDLGDPSLSSDISNSHLVIDPSSGRIYDSIDAGIFGIDLTGGNTAQIGFQGGGASGIVRDIGMLPNGQLAVDLPTLGYLPDVSVLDPSTGSTVADYAPTSSQANTSVTSNAAYDGNGHLLVGEIGSPGGVLYSIDLATGTFQLVRSDSVGSIAVGSDGTVYTLGTAGLLAMDPTTGATQTLPLHSSSVISLIQVVPTTVPEPAELTLLVVAGIALAGQRWGARS